MATRQPFQRDYLQAECEFLATCLEYAMRSRYGCLGQVTDSAAMRFPFFPLKSASPVARANPRKSCARAGLLLIISLGLSLGLSLGAFGQAGDSAARPRIGTRSGPAATLTGQLTNLRGGAAPATSPYSGFFFQKDTVGESLRG